MMRLTMLAKDPSSGDNGCPSVHLGDDGVAYVQADLAPEAHGSVPNFLPGEGVVRIEVAVLCAAVDAYRAGK